LVRHHLRLAELGRDHLGIDLVAVLAGNMAAHGVVARERAVAEGAGHADALVALPDVRAQVRLVAVGPLAERAFQLRA
jgi:hypothetical protein